MSASAAEAISPNERPFLYTDADFERVRKLIHAHAGISLADSKRDMVYSRLSRRLRATNIGSFRDYLDRLEAGSGDDWQEFTNTLTTNLTSFFREAHHFDALYKHLQAQPRGAKPLLIWCAAASTGEEPYSLAIIACEAFDSDTPPVRILATDIDTNVLQQGERGVYTEERIEELSTARKQRFFQRGSGANAGLCRVREPLRRLITFRPLNLLDERWPMHGPFTAIFCRNVMIYFDKPTQYRILQRAVPLLARDGLFFAGHSESFFHAADLVVPCGHTIYRPAPVRCT
ncbi:MAG: chemotaxis protein CheR [Nevskiaceae bacterium]|nr:MAG: chemotaxis protein CheR [Nevskiaceae bacterium]TBR73177.1 MAG: chemotaxis protein CheR [Nevskiaceae bacterium]